MNRLILLSELYGITIDRIVKDDDECNILLCKGADIDINKAVSFLVSAKKNTYPINENKVQSSRMKSSDFCYAENEYKYYDTYLGGEKFTGEEAIWYCDTPIWCMNYSGRVIGSNFNNGFLKEVLLQVTEKFPYRGPKIYTKGDYHYHCKVDGEFIWFQGYEDIFYLDEKIYECYFHGGVIQ